MNNTEIKSEMNERPTPETDAVAAYEGNWDTKALRMTDHARKLERERDEEREKYFAMRDLSNNATELAEKYKRERDQLKEALVIMEDLLKPGIELFPEIGEILKIGGAK